MLLFLTTNITNYLIVPGLVNSGVDHWQIHFEKSGNNFRRINQKEWDVPTCSDWTASIDKAIFEYDLTTVVLIGHSLVAQQLRIGCHNTKKNQSCFIGCPKRS